MNILLKGELFMFIFLIKEAREEKGVSQKELSEAVGISRSYLTELENNKN